jgi:hypothetical protein
LNYQLVDEPYRYCNCHYKEMATSSNNNGDYNPSIEMPANSNMGMVHQAIRNGNLELVKDAVKNGYIMGNVDIKIAVLYNQKKILLWMMKNDPNWEQSIDQYWQDAKL